MIYGYCDKCGCELKAPTAREDLIEGQLCPKCGNTIANQKPIEYWLVELYEQIEEEKLK